MKFSLLVRSLWLVSAAAILPLSADVVVTTLGVNCTYDQNAIDGNAGLCTAVTGATTITFDGLTSAQTSPYTSGIAKYSWGTSDNSPFVSGSVGGQYAAPPNDNTTYLTVGSGLPGRPNPVTIDFSTPISYFGMYLGSPDSYNVLAFNNGVLVKQFDGFSPNNGDQSIGQYLNFNATDSSSYFNQIVMTSNTAAFETDNHAYKAVPDGGMTLMLLGGALVGLETLRRKFRA